ncbi:methylated-DNA--[protein]-cysteine S-methyltransferase [Lysobacter cavernae]|uniref:Methylated-DNA--[protein]-cysteine S-methyltransferase n=1 Tax=Lysobacter cavernae TaxID=1685901 RepID=A0ABV7RM02_9GAMM
MNAPTIPTLRDPRWADLVARNRAADGRFVYSVRSTGVYCRPSCTARLPRPQNVRFHATPAEAEQAGFRPCQRCQPQRPDQHGVDHPIRFAMTPCSLGFVLVAVSTRGIRAILLGDTPDALARELQQRWPQARLVADADGLADRVRDVAAFIDAPQRGLDCVLDQDGTAFQQRVWRALRAIPVGATASYRDIAERIGAPTAARAVAAACAANVLAVAIPCHRVVRHDGGLSGYRWGPARKHALLQREARA